MICRKIYSISTKISFGNLKGEMIISQMTLNACVNVSVFMDVNKHPFSAVRLPRQSSSSERHHKALQQRRENLL